MKNPPFFARRPCDSTQTSFLPAVCRSAALEASGAYVLSELALDLQPSPRESSFIDGWLRRFGPYMTRRDLGTAKIAKRSGSYKLTASKDRYRDAPFPRGVKLSLACNAPTLWHTEEVARWAETNERSGDGSQDEAGVPK